MGVAQNNWAYVLTQVHGYLHSKFGEDWSTASMVPFNIHTQTDRQLPAYYILAEMYPVLLGIYLYNLCLGGSFQTRGSPENVLPH